MATALHLGRVVWFHFIVGIEQGRGMMRDRINILWIHYVKWIKKISDKLFYLLWIIDNLQTSIYVVNK